MSKAINAVKDGYLWLIDWVEDHPHAAAWIAVALIALAWFS